MRQLLPTGYPSIGALAMIAAGAGFLASACAQPFTLMNVEVMVPDLPPAWSEADGWEVSWLSADEAMEPVFATPGEVLNLLLPRMDEAAVFCRAVFGSRRTLPYGAAWPQDLGPDGFLRLSAAGGYAATLAATLYRSGTAYAGFDFQRFALEAGRRMSDPWHIDPERFAVIVLETRFRADHLGDPEVFDARLSGIPCVLYPDSPWGRVLEPDGMGMVMVSVAGGRVRRWLDGNYELTVRLSDSGEPFWTLAFSSVQSGILSVNVLPAPSRLSTETSPP